MLDIDMINKEIQNLEECNCTNWNICEKLATLYIIRDHFNNKKMQKVDEQPSPIKEKI